MCAQIFAVPKAKMWARAQLQNTTCQIGRSEKGRPEQSLAEPPQEHPLIKIEIVVQDKDAKR